MGINLLYILGNSDIYVNGVSLSKKPYFLDFTKFIVENMDFFNIKIGKPIRLETNEKKEIFWDTEEEKIPIEKIEFPIFGDFFFYVKEKYKTIPDNIFLFATKQSPSHPKDTYYLAQILKYVLQKTICRKQKDNIYLYVIEDDPSDYEKMDKCFSLFLQNYRDLLLSSSFNLFQIATGTPAMSFSLSLNLFTLPNTKYYYVSHMPEQERVREVKYFRILNLKTYAENLKKLLGVFEYAGAKEIFLNSPLSRMYRIRELLEIMVARRELRFEEGLGLARNLAEEDPERFLLVAEYFSDILSSRELNVWASFEEMEMYMERKEYHIALASYFNVMENLTSYLISSLGEDIENLKDKEGKYLSHPDKIKWVKDKLENDPLKNKFPYKLLFDDEFVKIEQCVREKRNKGPLAHGFKGIDQKDKENIEFLREKLREALHPLSFSRLQGKNFYKYMNEVIHDYLEENLSNL